MNSPTESAYYAVIPGDVRYDDDLPPPAKLLYGEVTSLCNKTGSCWATTEYFAHLYGLSVGTISRRISKLKRKGYIRCEMVATKNGSERRIYAGAFFVQQGGIDENENTPVGVRKNEDGGLLKNEERGLRKNAKQNNKDRLNKQESITPLPPKGDGRPKRESKYALKEEAKPILREYVGNDRELAMALADLIEIREAKGAINSAEAIKRLLKKLDELSGGHRADKLLLIDQSIENSWKSVFPLRSRSGGGASPPGASTVLEEEGTYAL